MEKKVIQRALPLDQTYKLLETFYSSLEDGGGHVCENCGRPISNIAKVFGEKYKTVNYIGMDCAETLTGINDDFLFSWVAKGDFQAAKSARQKILKLLKKAKESNLKVSVSVETFDHEKNFHKQIGSGIFRVESEPFNPHFSTWQQYEKSQWANHVLPMIKDLAQ